VKFLLDTHTLLWWCDGGARIGASAIEAISSEGSEVFFSLASAWEVAIKVSLGKLALRQATEGLFGELFKKYQFQPLPASLEDCLRVESLPWHHRDPFDRLLASQCLGRQLTLLSRDEIFDQYGVRRLW
jgi:PIN domain nuclease of toxin-antitoxin system